MQLADRRVRNLRLAWKIVGPWQRCLALERPEEDVGGIGTGRLIGQSELGAPFDRQRLRHLAQLHRRSPPPGRSRRSRLLGNRAPFGKLADHALELQSRRWMHSIS